MGLHDTLISLRNSLGYIKKERGLCVLYAEKAIDAYLIDDYAAFKQRLFYIQRMQSSAKGLGFFNQKLSDLSAEEKQKIIDVRAFIEQGELYSYSTYYHFLFTKHLFQKDVDEIALFAQPETLETSGGRVSLACFLGSYTQEDLQSLFKLLKNLVSSLSCNIALSLTTDNHRVALCYCWREKNWIIMDINNPDLMPIKTERHDELAYTIQVELFRDGTGIRASDDKISIFQTKIISVGNQPSVQKAINEMLISDQFKRLHDINPDRIARINRRGIDMLDMAVITGCHDTIKLLIEIKDNDAKLLLDFNRVDTNGMSLFYKATEQNDIGTTRLLAELKDSITGCFLVDCNKARVHGGTPVFIAAQEGYHEMIQLFTTLKTDDGEQRIDLNTCIPGRYTPFYIAAQNGHIEVMKLLITSMDAEKNAVVNHITDEGGTPILIAAQQGHVSIIEFLANLIDCEGKWIVDFNQADNDGVTPAAVAIEYGRIDVIRLFVSLKDDKGNMLVDFNKCDNTGITPIFLAIKKGHTEIVKILMESGCVDMNYRFNNLTLTESAEETKNQAIVNLISIYSSSSPQLG